MAMVKVAACPLACLERCRRLRLLAWVIIEGAITVFYEEMWDFLACLAYTERSGAHEVGLAKVMPHPALP